MGMDKVEERAVDICNRCWHEINFKANVKKTTKTATEGFEIFGQDGLMDNLAGITSSKRRKTEESASEKPLDSGLLKYDKRQKMRIIRDEQGNIQFPVIVSNSLKILDLGKIEHERPAFHTEKNYFPIGFKSIRDHLSMVTAGEKVPYTCEIIDGGTRPMYRVTPSDDENYSITRSSATGCWLDIVQRVNLIMNNRNKNSLTVSGPERFGLSDDNVIGLLKQLPDAEKCLRFIKK